MGVVRVDDEDARRRRRLVDQALRAHDENSFRRRKLSRVEDEEPGVARGRLRQRRNGIRNRDVSGGWRRRRRCRWTRDDRAKLLHRQCLLLPQDVRADADDPVVPDRGRQLAFRAIETLAADPSVYGSPERMTIADVPDDRREGFAAFPVCDEWVDPRSDWERLRVDRESGHRAAERIARRQRRPVEAGRAEVSEHLRRGELPHRGCLEDAGSEVLVSARLVRSGRPAVIRDARAAVRP